MFGRRGRAVVISCHQLTAVRSCSLARRLRTVKMLEELAKDYAAYAKVDINDQASTTYYI